MADNIKRYFMRGVEIDAPAGEEAAFAYAKLPRFAIFGIVVPTSIKWEGTRVSAKSGVIQPGHLALPIEVGDYFNERARRTKDPMDRIPDNHLDKIEAQILQDPRRAIAGDGITAMFNDERLFGTRTILRRPKGIG